MPGDYTRFSFDPFEDHLGVLLQQGRVVLDADFNELVQMLERRIRVGTFDTIGSCAVPKTTSDGFRIQIAGTTVTIGRGRIYVHGLLAENHGKAPLEYDPRVGELRGTLPLPYDEQPYLPDAAAISPMPGSGGPHLLYIDVWQREITYLEEPDLVEKAVAVDTATRLQTVWQVKALPNVGAITCATPDGEIPGWLTTIAPSAGRLTTAAVGVPASTDPCIVNPVGGYRGTENRLYRVEIHDKGGAGAPATWKWSRDNNSIGAAVLGINAALDQLTVDRTRRDAIRGFHPSDWVEVTDDRHELAQTPGLMRKVLTVDDVAGTITLAAALPAGEFDVANPTARHMRIRRWDQKGQVLDQANAVMADVDASGGVIPVSTSATFVLEDGVQVSFSLAPATGAFRVGDYWAFAARTVDASVEILTAAPPRGITHHYCRLALVTFPAGVVDCRTLWPPDFGGHGCDCSECVTAEGHNSGAATIQMAIERVKGTGGKVCLGPGVFTLGTSPVIIQGAQSVQLHGHGLRTLLTYAGPGAAIQVSSSTDIGVDSLSVLAVLAERPNLALAVTNSALVRIERTILVQFGRSQDRPGAAIGLSGFLAEVFLRDNVVFGAIGIQSLARGTVKLEATRTSYTATFGLYVESNVVIGLDRGVDFGGQTYHLGETRLAGNSIYGCRQAAVSAEGIVLRTLIGSSRFDVLQNEVMTFGHGIVFGTDDTRVCDNDIGVLRIPGIDRQLGLGTGIALRPVPDADAMAQCMVMTNRITGLRGDAVAIEGRVSALLIKQNIIDGVAGGGIVMQEKSEAEDLSIENNQILRAAPPEGEVSLGAIRLVRATRAAIVSNLIDGFAITDARSPIRAGILVLASESVRIAGNDIVNVGPPDEFIGLGGGIVAFGPFDRLDVVDNAVRRSTDAVHSSLRSPWFGVLTAAPTFGLTPKGTGVFTRGRISLFPLAAAKQPAGFVFVFDDRVIVARTGADRVSVRGNTVEAYGSSPAVDVRMGGAGTCIVSDNHLLQNPGDAGPPVARLEAGAVICSANHLRSRPDHSCLELFVGAVHFTLLGNVRNGSISLNGTLLPSGSVWAPLNAFLP